MPGFRTVWPVVVVGVVVNLTLNPAQAAIPEWNPARTHPVQIGPEAKRLVVGFRATPGQTVVQTVRLRATRQSIDIIQAKTSDADAAGLAQRTGLAMQRSRQITPSMHVLYLQKTLYGAEVHAALKKLRADPSVEFADIDQRRYPHTMPDDPLFLPSAGASGQWFMQPPSTATPTSDFSATDAASAWAITTGSTGTVIADVDTGVRFDHPDLLRAGFGGRLLPGYDFVDQDYNRNSPYNALGTFLMANDGDAWDPDPSDPGDWINSTDQQNSQFPAASCPTSDSSWHGTRVMGVLGAITNNGVGVAGMTWNPYLLPVRALGKCGGYDSDIITGMQWAAGISVPGVPVNPYPADIVNLSLGGSGACPSAYQSAINTLAAMGVLVVASAGNESGPVDAPGNCSGVLAVAGLRNVGTKVGYSSFGPEVGVAAPAGNCVNTIGPCLRSIDTTVNAGLTTPGANGYTNETNPNLGTSFSAPIVSGIVALMRAVNANLTPAQLITRIKSSASPFPPAGAVPQCTTSNGSSECACGPNQCGTGMVNALSAVNAALNPIAVIKSTGVDTFDAGGSVGACNLGVATYAWTTSGGVTITGSKTMAQVTVVSSGSVGTLTVTVTDSAGHKDSGSVSFSAAGAATVNAPQSAGSSATACPTPMTFTPAAPTVAEAFTPASVGESSASTLTITFANTNGFALTQSTFTETVPAILTIETSPAPTTTCTGANGTLTTSASAMTLASAVIPANGSCSITVSIKSATPGTYTNTIAAHALSTGPAGGNSAAASASLTVTTSSASASGTSTSKSGGGALDWLDMMFAAGVLLAGRRQAGRRASR